LNPDKTCAPSLGIGAECDNIAPQRHCQQLEHWEWSEGWFPALPSAINFILM